ncbi:MAG: sugar phosphate isomerase/epimerase [Clostridiales bacterium]|nr:sugar phosphate isomerase/epimerase [Clostridiales bacterium]
MKIGAQLYNVRDFVQNEEGLKASLEKIAGMGYKYVQYSGVGDGIPAKTFRRLCDEYALECPLSHIDQDKILRQTDKVIEDQLTIGAKYLGIPIFPFNKYSLTVEDIDQFIADYTPAAEAMKAAGLQCMYHNHHIEFVKVGGKLIIDRIMEGFDKEIMGLVLDTYWVQAGGGDPSAYLEKFAGRVDTIHLKDMTMVGNKERLAEQRFAEILEGNLNWDRIFPATEKAGVLFAFIEQDYSYEKDPFDCLKTSLDNINKHLA